MKYIFCSFMFDDVEENVKNSKSPNSVSGHKFQVNILTGLVENGCDVCVLNVPRIRRYPDYKRIVVKKRLFKNKFNINAKSIVFINLQGINYITQILALYYELKKMLKNNSDETIWLITYNTYLAPIIAMRQIRKKYDNVKICNIIGDIYGKYGLTEEKSLHGKFIGLVHKYMDNMASECDAFAFATENMSKALGVTEKPFVVIEGIYEIENEFVPNHSDDSKKKVFYAGALFEEYGIGHMLRAFELITDKSYEFLIAGNGDAVDLIKDMSAKDSRIKYLGFITPNEVEKCQNSSTVLVNPRTSDYEYVKYSFASKNLECLASGIPYVAHKLPCNPKEYGEYVIYPYDESDMALANAIKKVCEMSSVERENIGLRNREFIREYKNPKVQIGKLVQLLSSL